MASADDEFVPGMRVLLTGLFGNASLNGRRGTIRPSDDPSQKEAKARGRLAVRLDSSSAGGSKDNIAVKPQNLVPLAAAENSAVSDACIICLEPAEAGAPLLQPGCGCRGTAGRVHERCAIAAAAAEQARAGTWAGKHPWQLCQTCKLPYTGALKLALAQEWCRRTEPLTLADTQRFASRTTLSNALSAAGRLAEAETVVRGNLEAATELHGAEHRLTLGTTLNLGLLLDGQGKHKEARAVYADLLAVQRRVLGEEHRDTLSTAMQMASAALNQGRNAEAEAQFRHVHAAMCRVASETDPAALTCAMNLASAVLNQGRYAEAEGLYRANLDAKRRKLGPEHVDTLMAAMNLGSALKEVGRYGEAEACFQDNHQTKAKVLGAEHADACFAALNLCATWVDGAQENRYDEARAMAEKATRALGKAFGEEHPSVLGAQMHVAVALHALGRVVEAVQMLREVHAAQLRVHHGEATHPDVLETAWRLGRALLAVEHPTTPIDLSPPSPPLPPPPPAPPSPPAAAEEAMVLLRATADVQAQQLGDKHPRTLRSLVSLAEALLAAGGAERAAEAATLVNQCEPLQRSLLDERHPDLARTQRLSLLLSSAGATTLPTATVLPTARAVSKELQLRAEAASWDAPTDPSQIPWASVTDIPIIDLSALLSSTPPDDGAIAAIAERLRLAATSTGFHYIVGHGVPKALVDSAFRAAATFHALADEDKEALAMDTPPAREGEVRAGCGYLREANKKLPARAKPNMNAAFVVKRECGPRDVTLDRMPWPDEAAHPTLKGFREAVEAYCDAMEALAVHMLPAYAVALGLPKGYFDEAFERPLFRLRLSRYAPTPPGEYGINPHVDTSFFTILRPSAAGLVVQTRGGSWVKAPFRQDEDSFVVNFGELLAQVTNDQWPATRHYALNSGDGGRSGGSGGQERFALPFFFNATPTYRMAVAPTCCSDDNPAKYPPISYLEGQGVQQGE